MKIEVGEYVRINNDFRLIALGIGKVIRINQDTIYVKMNFELPFAFKIENIAKHSKNIIDLIEEGDIVDKSEVYEIGQSDDGQKWVHTYNGKLYYENELVGKTILTKEQYMKNCYKIDTNQQT